MKFTKLMVLGIISTSLLSTTTLADGPAYIRGQSASSIGQTAAQVLNSGTSTSNGITNPQRPQSDEAPLITYDYATGTSTSPSASEGNNSSPAEAYMPGAFPNANKFISAGTNAEGNLQVGNVVNKVDESISSGFENILKALYGIGTIVAICVFAFMGVQFIIASPQQKAQLKASLLPYFVGLLLFIAGVPIAIFIINLFLQLL